MLYVFSFEMLIVIEIKAALKLSMSRNEVG